MKTYSYEQAKNALGSLLTSKASFEVVGLRGNFNEAIKTIETAIESKGMKCRVETDIKGTIVAGSAMSATAGIFLGLTTVGACLVYGASKVVHTAFTYNPDYEIEKDYINKKLRVKYKK